MLFSIDSIAKHYRKWVEERPKKTKSEEEEAEQTGTYRILLEWQSQRYVEFGSFTSCNIVRRVNGGPQR